MLVNKEILGNPIRLDGIRMMRLLAGMGNVTVYPDLEGLPASIYAFVQKDPDVSEFDYVVDNTELLNRADKLGKGCFREGPSWQSGNIYSVVFLDDIPKLIRCERT